MTINPADYGFDQARYLEPVYAPRASVNSRNERLRDDPRDIMPNAKTVILLLKKWIPYRQVSGEPTLSSYYVASNSAHAESARLADCIRSNGFEAVADAQIAIKPMLARFGGEAGLNSLISFDGFGTRFHAQTIISDMPAPIETVNNKRARLHTFCENCGACRKACPTAAISPNGRIDLSRCLRALDDGEPLPEELRAKFGNSLLGCDICQSVCPRNRSGEFSDMPEELRGSLNIKQLLSGDMGCLAKYIGRNNARLKRIRMKAALVAANNMRSDCLDQLEALAKNGLTGERVHAMWAIEQIKRRIA